MSDGVGFVSMGTQMARVENTRDTVLASYYVVRQLSRGGQPFPGEVRVGSHGVFTCLTCRRVDCIHADAVRKFVAAQPLDPTGTAGTDDRRF